MKKRAIDFTEVVGELDTRNIRFVYLFVSVLVCVILCTNWLLQATLSASQSEDMATGRARLIRTWLIRSSS